MHYIILLKITLTRCVSEIVEGSMQGVVSEARCVYCISKSDSQCLHPCAVRRSVSIENTNYLYMFSRLHAQCQGPNLRIRPKFISTKAVDAVFANVQAAKFVASAADPTSIPKSVGLPEVRP